MKRIPQKICLGLALATLTLSVAGCAPKSEENPSATPQTQSEAPSPAPEANPADPTVSPVAAAFEDALLSRSKFPCADSGMPEEIYLSDLVAADTDDTSPAQFAVVDMNGDGVPEVVYQRSNYIGFVVLRYEAGQIYGYSIPYRGLLELKQDGSYSASSSAFASIVGKMRFLGDTYETDVKLSSVEADASHFYLHEEEVDEATFRQHMDEYESREAATWFAFTETDVTEQLAAHFAAQTGDGTSPMQTYLNTLADIAKDDYVVTPDTTEAELEAEKQRLFSVWNQAMENIYSLCADQLSGAELDALAAEQQAWGALREQQGANFDLVISMTKMRTFSLISHHFGDNFYE